MTNRDQRPGHPSFGVPEIPLTGDQAAKRLEDIRSAELLGLPEIASATETGLVLNVAAVGLAQNTAGIVDQPYLRCADRTLYRLPDELGDWALEAVQSNHFKRQQGGDSLFPCEIEFGVLEGRAYAQFVM